MWEEGGEVSRGACCSALFSVKEERRRNGAPSRTSLSLSTRSAQR